MPPRDRLSLGVVERHPARCFGFEHDPVDLLAAVVPEQVDHPQAEARPEGPEGQRRIDPRKFL